MPLAALRLQPDQLQLLQRLGLRRIGQLATLPRAALVRRLGRTLVDRLDEALGRRASPLATQLEVPPWRAERRLLEPIWIEDHVLSVIADLASDLGPRLEAAGLGARRLVLELCRVDGAVRRLQVATSAPVRERDRIATLFRERLAGLNEGLEADFGFDQLRLVALGLQPLVPRTARLIGEEGRAGDCGEAGFAALADRLAARLGPDAVRRFVLHPERRLPEEGASLQPHVDRAGHGVARGAVLGGIPEPPSFAGAPLRPLRLLQPPQPIEVLAELPDGPPERFRWRRVARRVVCAEGPERIEPEWWRGAGIAQAGPRDYYRLEDEKGFRYWVFRQGLYTGEAPPRWYVQGLFA
jgi:protein ImuB